MNYTAPTKCERCDSQGVLSVVYVHYRNEFSALCPECEEVYWNEVALEQAIALDVEEVLYRDYVPAEIRRESLEVEPAQKI